MIFLLREYSIFAGLRSGTLENLRYDRMRPLSWVKSKTLGVILNAVDGEGNGGFGGSA